MASDILYDILLTRVPNERLANLVARHLAENPHVSLEKAKSMLQNLPVVYERELDESQKDFHVRRLQGLGVGVKVVETHRKPSPPKPEIVETAPRRDSAPSPAMPARTHRPLQRSWSSSPAPPPPPPPRSRWRSVLQGSLAVAIIGLLIGAYMLTSSRERFQESAPGTPRQSKRHGSPEASAGTHDLPGSEVARAAGRNRAGGRGRRARTTPEQRTHSAGYVDSAAACGSDHERAIRFYLIALSFNEHNLQAWYGLIQAYRAAGRAAEAREAEARMRELFGDAVTSVRALVEPFGELVDYSQDRQGTCRLEYRSSGRGQERLVRESFELARALSVGTRCRHLALFATTGPGAGVLVRTRLSPFPASFSAFRNRAMISHVGD
jgi:tetratricopeptide (TPR) repeat protein